ncbi:MAG: aminoglycoside phosphotransferase family protein [Lautropia sp.]
MIVALRDAASPLAAGLVPDAIVALADTGLAHAHWRLGASGVLARVPKQSQMRLAARANLAYQRACFARAAPSGHTPRLHGVLEVSEALPRGALLVEEIPGRKPALPAQLDPLVDALAAIHALETPAHAARAPLLAPADPLRALLQEIDAQAPHLRDSRVPDRSRRAIDERLSRMRRLAGAQTIGAISLIAFDAHPGNFLVRDDGTAVLVDLEKARYGLASLDLAHATLYTSTTWERGDRVVLDADRVARAYLRWQHALGASRAGSPDDWLLQREAMWLWSVTWCAMWTARAGDAADARRAGDDWSASLSEAALIEHVRERVSHYLAADTVDAVLDGFDALRRRLGC